MDKSHKILTKEDCNCKNLNSDYECPICDWGLSICKLCRKAEKDLFEPCEVVDMSKTKLAKEIAGTGFEATVYDNEDLIDVQIERIESNGDHYHINMNLSSLNCKEISNYFIALSHTVKLGEDNESN